jgi:uncharacterized membrane protein YeiB
MLLAHFAYPFTDGEPGYLQAVDNTADGRAAPLFCMLLGVGAGILSARGAPAATFVRRGLLLLVLGLAIWPITSEVLLILPHYGVLLLFVPLLRRIATRWLLVVALGAFLVPSIVTATVHDHAMRASGQPDTYAELWDITDILRQIFWTGGYPLVGWTGFALVGLWVARLPLAHRGTQRRLLVGGIAIAALQPIAAALFHAVDDGRFDTDARGWAAFFDSTDHSNDLAWYVIAAGTAVAVIAVCLIVPPHFARALRPIACLGSMMLSAYLLHLVLGAHVVWVWLDEEEPSLFAQMVVVAVVFAGFVAAANLWARHFRRGPVEMLLRAVSR